jgi:hypothetical protein
MSYGLRWNPNPPLAVATLVTYAIVAGFYTILSWLGVIALPAGVGVSMLFVAIGFGIPFAIWFGGWGLLIGYIGTFLGAGLLGGTPILLCIPFGFADWIQFGIPLLAYRLLAPRLGLHALGKDVYTLRGMAFFLIFGTILPNSLGALYGVSVLYLGNLVAPNAYWLTVLSWALGNLLVAIIIAPLLLRLLSPVVERLGLATYGILT